MVFVQNHYRFDLMTQLYLHKTNRRRVVISTPQRSSVQPEIINETDQEVAAQRSSVRTESINGTVQELIVDVAHHDNEETVTKPNSDVDQLLLVPS